MIIILFLFLLLNLLFPGDAFAAYHLDPNIQRQDHYYSVIFRENGEAAVAFKTLYVNKAMKNTSELNVSIPGVNPSRLAVYQIVMDRHCSQYVKRTDSGSCRYEEPDRAHEIKELPRSYLKADSNFNGEILTISLPVAVSPNGVVGLFIYFRTNAFTTEKDFLGNYTFKFHTMVFSDFVENLTLKIYGDIGLELKGSDREASVDTSFPALLKIYEIESIKNLPGVYPEFDALVRRVGELNLPGRESFDDGGYIYKNRIKTLAPFETYSITGVYGKSFISVYLAEIMVSLIIIILSILFYYGLALFLARRLIRREIAKIPNKPKKYAGILILNSVVSLLLVVLIENFLGSNFFGTAGFSYQFDLFNFTIYSVIILIPVIAFTFKKGWRWGLGQLILSITIFGLMPINNFIGYMFRTLSDRFLL